MKIVATVRKYLQVGINEHQYIDISRVFDEHRTIRDIKTWAEAETGKPVTCFSLIQISDYTGESI